MRAMNPHRLALAAGALALASACATSSATTPAVTGTAPNNALPPVTLTRYPDGTPLSLGAERGNVVVLDFWATWCEPCKAALPEWDALAASYQGRNVHLYAVSVDEDPNKVAAFLQQVKVDVPVLLDRDAAVAEGTLHLQVVPTAFIIDPSGVIRGVHQGYAPADVKGFAKEIDPLLGQASK
jgi:thiol-disulfide isomerase/thioredoxin